MTSLTLRANLHEFNAHSEILASAAAAPSTPARPSLPARILVIVVRVYQASRQGRPSPCRYLPTCSAYAIGALERHGAARGSWLAVRRVSRCHPWGGRGVDPVPE